MSLDEKDRAELIRYRLDEAKDTLDDVHDIVNYQRSCT